MKTKILGLSIGMIILICVFAALNTAGDEELLLSDYPDAFKNDTYPQSLKGLECKEIVIDRKFPVP